MNLGTIVTLKLVMRPAAESYRDPEHQGVCDEARSILHDIGITLHSIPISFSHASTSNISYYFCAVIILQFSLRCKNLFMSHNVHTTTELDVGGEIQQIRNMTSVQARKALHEVGIHAVLVTCLQHLPPHRME